MLIRALLPIILMTTTAVSTMAKNDDPFMWLEDVEGAKALEWVGQHNAATAEHLSQHPEFNAVQQQCLDIFNSDDRIAYPSIRGEYVYNFWRDEQYRRGLWRRAKLADYLKDAPQWETLLDIDALNKKEGENWTFKGVSVLYPDMDLCMVKVARGGSDALVTREFNIDTKAFVKDGFFLDEAKSVTSWFDRDTLMISTDFGEGSKTDSGYPRITKLWKRGTPLSEAVTLFEGEKEDVSVRGYVAHYPDRNYAMITRGKTFYTRDYHAYEQGRVIKLDVPEETDLRGFFKGQVLAELKNDWTVDGRTYKQGALLSLDYDKLLGGKHDISVIFEPARNASLGSVSSTKDKVLITAFINGQYDEMFAYEFSDGQWACETVATPERGTLSVQSTDDESNQFFFTYESRLTPDSLYYADDEGKISKVRSLPEFFDTAGMRVEFNTVKSKDGTEIPYSVVYPRNAKLNGDNPTILYGYGGFEISLRPNYSSIMGSCWLSRGGVYVTANIRGGGEFGPQWHQSALKENRQRSYDDFAAVAEDLVKRKICSSKSLGIMGGSNGGLLVGVAFTQRPELYNAVVCAVPLLDMKRFNVLLAGASWMGEYGNPDVPEEWSYIKKYSPYHNLDQATKYPKVFFKTSTRDDRVHPAHARKMAAKMEDMKLPVFYYENTEGGHGAGVTNDQRAMEQAMVYAYFLEQLK